MAEKENPICCLKTRNEIMYTEKDVIFFFGGACGCISSIFIDLSKRLNFNEKSDLLLMDLMRKLQEQFNSTWSSYDVDEKYLAMPFDDLMQVQRTPLACRFSKKDILCYLLRQVTEPFSYIKAVKLDMLSEDGRKTLHEVQHGFENFLTKVKTVFLLEKNKSEELL